MNEESAALEKFVDGYKANDEEKKKYRNEIQEMINDEKLFVSPVQPHVRGLHRSDVYSMIHPIYTSATLEETLGNCFQCSKCAHIFLHLRTNGTGPFNSHKCYKAHLEAIKKAEILANMADKKAEQAAAYAASAKEAVENMRSQPPVAIEDDADAMEDADDAMLDAAEPDLGKRSRDKNDPIEKRIEPALKRSRHAEVVATTIERFVNMALNGKAVKANDIIDYVPADFINYSWQQFVDRIERKTPKKFKLVFDQAELTAKQSLDEQLKGCANVKVILNRIEPDEFALLLKNDGPVDDDVDDNMSDDEQEEINANPPPKKGKVGVKPSTKKEKAVVKKSTRKTKTETKQSKSKASVQMEPEEFASSAKNIGLVDDDVDDNMSDVEQEEINANPPPKKAKVGVKPSTEKGKKVGKPSTKKGQANKKQSKPKESVHKMRLRNAK